MIGHDIHTIVIDYFRRLGTAQTTIIELIILASTFKHLVWKIFTYKKWSFSRRPIPSLNDPPPLFILSKFFSNLKLSVGLKIQDAFIRLLI